MGNNRTDEPACKKIESLEWSFIKWARISFLEKGEKNKTPLMVHKSKIWFDHAENIALFVSTILIRMIIHMFSLGTAVGRQHTELLSLGSVQTLLFDDKRVRGLGIVLVWFANLVSYERISLIKKKKWPRDMLKGAFSLSPLAFCELVQLETHNWLKTQIFK